MDSFVGQSSGGRCVAILSGYSTKPAGLHWYGRQAGASLGVAHCRKSRNRGSREDILPKHQFYPARACHSPVWLLLPVVPEKSAICDFTPSLWSTECYPLIKTLPVLLTASVLWNAVQR